MGQNPKGASGLANPDSPSADMTINAFPRRRLILPNDGSGCSIHHHPGPRGRDRIAARRADQRSVIRPSSSIPRKMADYANANPPYEV